MGAFVERRRNWCKCQRWRDYIVWNYGSYAKKVEAEDAAKNVKNVKGVKGVKAVVEDIEIKFASTWKKTDSEIANEVINALQLDWAVPKGKVNVKVEDGWVNLEGDLPWNYQKESVKKTIKNLDGVQDVMNYSKSKQKIPIM